MKRCAPITNKYQVHRLGDITDSDVLGVRVCRDRTQRVVTLDLEDYISNFLKSTHTEGGIPYWDCSEISDTPCNHSAALPNALAPGESSGIGSKFNYLSRVMTLMYPALIYRPYMFQSLEIFTYGVCV